MVTGFPRTKDRHTEKTNFCKGDTLKIKNNFIFLSVDRLWFWRQGFFAHFFGRNNIIVSCIRYRANLFSVNPYFRDTYSRYTTNSSETLTVVRPGVQNRFSPILTLLDSDHNDIRRCGFCCCCCVLLFFSSPNLPLRGIINTQPVLNYCCSCSCYFCFCFAASL